MKIYDYKVSKRNGELLDLNDFKGKAILIVNTATGCGFTPQYEGLEDLYKKYHEKGLEILDFPCNQFGNQAAGTDDEIHEFCSFKYHTTFDQLKKIEVNGDNEEPLYTYLKSQIINEETNGLKDKMTMKMIEKMSSTCKKDGDIKWNFTKFLVDKDGNVVGRYSPTTKPELIEQKIKDILEVN